MMECKVEENMKLEPGSGRKQQTDLAGRRSDLVPL